MNDIDTRIYNFIVEYKTRHDGVAPTLEEIGQCIGVPSRSQVAFYLRRMVKAGRIAVIPRTTRGIMVTGGSWLAPVEAGV